MRYNRGPRQAARTDISVSGAAWVDRTPWLAIVFFIAPWSKALSVRTLAASVRRVRTLAGPHIADTGSDGMAIK
jgi:hypothetical protein